MQDTTPSVLARIRELERASRALEPGAAERRRLRNAVVASTERFLKGVHETPAYVETDDKGSRLLASPISEAGIPLDAALAHIEHDVVRPGGQPAAPGYLAYIPGGGLYHSALGDYLGAVTNKYAGIFFAGPGPVRMENMLIRWVADLVGYPASAGGNIASGGSIANLVAIATARDAHGVSGARVSSAVVYLTTQAHHCIEKALRLAGLGDVQVRHVALDDRFRMQADALAQAIADDRARGLRPWMVIASAGTTDTGAVDPLDAIATIAQRERCWFHVDAAYGGFFLLTEAGRRLMRGIERSDSAVLDPHKTLFLPYGTGIVVVRDAAPPRGHAPLPGELHAGRDARARGGVARRRVARAHEALSCAAHVAAADPVGHQAVCGGARRETAARALLSRQGERARVRGGART